MCGIAGYIGKKEVDYLNIKLALELMKNRGPNNQSYEEHQVRDNKVYLLHSRLSIIDLDSRSNQPFTIDGCTIIFNGEIYNYIELREKIKKEFSFVFKTDSDTEVVLAAYLLYGEDCVEYLEGMWSFAIFDKRHKRMLLSRDRFGEKPLYYLETPDGFYFGSEIKFLQALLGKKLELNEQQMLRYLVNGHKSLYKEHAETFYKDVKELPRATNMIVLGDGRKMEHRFWWPSYTPTRMKIDEAIDGARHHLIESVRLRLRSDVPLAFCLSGGVDSSSLVSIASKILNYNVNTFSIIDDDERYNEQENINHTLADLGCKNTKIKLTPGIHNFERLKKLIRYHDSPIYTISYLVHSMLSEKISECGYKIATSGTGADEIFTGYYDHHNLYLCEMRNQPNIKKILQDWDTHQKKFVRNPFLKDPKLYFKDPSFREHIYLNNQEFAKYLNDDFSEPFVESEYTYDILRNRMMNEMFHEVIPVILHEDDLNSMMYSVENRSPFLDSKLFEFMSTVPTEYLIQNGFNKYILRESMKGILNDNVRLCREKKGFNASINSIINFKNKEQRDYILTDSPVYDIVKRYKIEKLIQNEQFTNSYKKFLFNFLNLKVFLELQ
ncbi:asparagine synthase (glutamine-hydrolyzing) [Candidatus Pacearchaeota archaeon]|nr:asparagine synthase (glutamine-hydrolyzing) [Candidatus Pacearchaeota archaeon]|tara:strand:+ start:3025 stop:4851 length:1827 start_codon:yes stop_codon:yes gene_type:complete